MNHSSSKNKLGNFAPKNDNSLRKPRRDSRYNSDCRCDFNRNEQNTAWNQEGRIPSRPQNDYGRTQPGGGNQQYGRQDYGRNQNDYNTSSPGGFSQTGDFNEVGMASWYGREFDGKKTASGQIFDSRRLTAAHRTLPLGTVIKVRNMDNGKEVVVTVNDRGPYVQGRILDISEQGAEMLDFKQRGLANVGIKILRQGRGPSGRVSGGESRGGNEVETAFTGESDFSRSDSGQQGGDGEGYYQSTGRSGGSGETRYSDYNDSMGYAESTPRSESRRSGYSIQVGAFSSRFNADSFKDTLRTYGKPVRVVRRNNQFVVLIDGFKSRNDAERVNRRLRDDGYSSFLVR